MTQSRLGSSPLMLRSLHAPEAGSPAGDALTEVLRKSTRVSKLVEECSDELADVNAGLQLNLQGAEADISTHVALRKNQAVEDKVACVADEIAEVNTNLSDHVNDRSLLRHELAAVVKREAAARHLALHDSLTGLPNRALLDDRLAHGLAMATRHRWGLALMFIDLDAFKQINDTHGHAAGDRVLKSVALRMLENTRSDDTVSRYGGDEFVYLMMDVKSETTISQFAEKLLASIQTPCEVATRAARLRLVVRASIGIAVFPQHGRTAEGLMHLADSAMYQAKHSGSGYAFAI